MNDIADSSDFYSSSAFKKYLVQRFAILEDLLDSTTDQGQLERLEELTFQTVVVVVDVLKNNGRSPESETGSEPEPESASESASASESEPDVASNVTDESKPKPKSKSASAYRRRHKKKVKARKHQAAAKQAQDKVQRALKAGQLQFIQAVDSYATGKTKKLPAGCTQLEMQHIIKLAMECDHYLQVRKGAEDLFAKGDACGALLCFENCRDWSFGKLYTRIYTRVVKDIRSKLPLPNDILMISSEKRDEFRSLCKMVLAVPTVLSDDLRSYVELIDSLCAAAGVAVGAAAGAGGNFYL